MITLTRHAGLQAMRKGISLDAVLKAANDPSVTYEHKVPGQHRHIRGGIVTVVDRGKEVVITVYANVVETPLRQDQVA